MKADVQKAWVDALRSGEYKQAKGRLEKDGAYCCLGVLCELAAQAGVVTKTQREVGEDERELWTYYQGDPEGYDNESHILPKRVQEWAGLDSSVPLAPDTGYGLSHLNDDKGYTFAQIADIIEAEF